jgi:hypothetical protein
MYNAHGASPHWLFSPVAVILMFFAGKRQALVGFKKITLIIENAARICSIIDEQRWITSVIKRHLSVFYSQNKSDYSLRIIQSLCKNRFFFVM